MRVVLVANQARAVSNFWSVLLRGMQAQGHELVCLVPAATPEESVWEEHLQMLGVRVVHYPLDRKGLKPWADLQTLLALRRLFRELAPDVLFLTTIKPVIYGAFAAALAGVPCKAQRHAMITGLGYMFEANTAYKRVLRWLASVLYKNALRCVGTVFFQNEDDRELFVQRAIVPSGLPIAMSKGTGVDTKHFSLAPPVLEPVRFLFVGRLLEAKGLYDIYEAARLLHRHYPQAEVQILGPEEHGRGAVPIATVHAWADEGVLQYLGSTEDVRPYLAAASVVMLPSWREGVPCSLMEAMSMGRPLIATDVPGCREVVEHGENGFLVPVGQPQALAQAMEEFIKNPALIERMGLVGRHKALHEFDAVEVARLLMERLLAVPKRPDA